MLKNNTLVQTKMHETWIKPK